jgi:hypothetical protein
LYIVHDCGVSFTNRFLFSAFHLYATPIVLFYEKYIGIAFFAFIAPFIDAFAKLRKATNGFICPSALPHETTRLPLGGFL